MKQSKALCYCIRLGRAANAVTAHYNRALAPTGLTLRQFFLLRSLERLGSGSVMDLAVRMELDRTTLSRTLRPLTERGLIRDCLEPGHRSRRLELTEQGHHLLSRGAPLWEAAQAEMEQRLGTQELEQILSALEKI